uniref:Uncharacterized protein n=1 Tax=Oryza meridionalis TaxID=40149 RepID=A0A0E0EBN8_9ORYZ
MCVTGQDTVTQRDAPPPQRDSHPRDAAEALNAHQASSAAPHPPPAPPSRSSPPPPPSRLRRLSFTLNAHQASSAAPSARAWPTVGAEVPTFAKFSQAELRTATGGFAAANIVLESSEKVPNLVYKGRLQGAGRAVGMLLPQRDAQLYLVGIT